MDYRRTLVPKRIRRMNAQNRRDSNINDQGMVFPKQRHVLRDQRVITGIQNSPHITLANNKLTATSSKNTDSQLLLDDAMDWARTSPSETKVTGMLPDYMQIVIFDEVTIIF